MAKFKPARGRKSAAKRPSAAGCIFLLVVIFGLFWAVMYLALKGG